MVHIEYAIKKYSRQLVSDYIRVIQHSSNEILETDVNKLY